MRDEQRFAASLEEEQRQLGMQVMTSSGVTHRAGASFWAALANRTMGRRYAPTGATPTGETLTAALRTTTLAPAEVSPPPGAVVASTAEVELADAFKQTQSSAVEPSGPVFSLTTTAGLIIERTSVEQTVIALTRHLEEAPVHDQIGWLIITPDGSSYSGQVNTALINADAETYLQVLSQHVERLNAALIRDHLLAMRGGGRRTAGTKLIP